MVVVVARIAVFVAMEFVLARPTLPTLPGVDGTGDSRYARQCKQGCDGRLCGKTG